MAQKEKGYPLVEIDNRTLPEGFDEPVYIWDVDKTYLVTHFSSLRGVSRIPIEFAVDKRAIPGMPEILRGLRRGPGPGVACSPLYFVTGSPPLLRKVLEQKMLVDGVEFDGITFKDWIRTIRERRPGRLREQVGYKVCALLSGRLRRPMATEYLFGDDVEKDATAFTLYAMLVHGELSSGEAVAKLIEAGVKRDDRKSVIALLNRLPGRRGSIKRIFIHLSANTPPSRFELFGKIVKPVQNAFQLGLSLYEHGLIDEETLCRCCEEVFAGSAAGREAMEACLADAEARDLVSASHASRLKDSLPVEKTVSG